MEAAGRKVLVHDVPPWIDPDASDYFITFCSQPRGINQLCLPDVGAALIASARFYCDQRKWLPWVFVLMPDHVHLIAGFSRQYRLEQIIEAWKRYTATRYRIVWQRGFFEHRLRRNESAEEKAEYLRQNPVRAGLARTAEEWPFLLEWHG